MHTNIRRIAAVAAVAGVIAASCSGSSDSTPTDTGGDGTTAPTEAGGDTETTETADTAAPDTAAPDTAAPDSATPDSAAPDTAASGGGDEGFDSLGPATGEPIVLGMVNTEGPAGLDFPEMRTDTDQAVAYLNEHGGFGGRPVVVEHCTAAGSPESSQECAQELAGMEVELTMLGLDLFPGYDTFAASEIPVVGALPILPADYSADALFITGGNATTMAAMVALAVEHFDAQTVGIISADNPGANGSEQSLKDSLDKAGITYKSVKGGDNETDAGFQGLMREANSENPDILVSLYADAGCIGTMRGRVSLGIDTPTVSTGICGSAEVIEVVGDDALGWYFVGAGGPDDTPSQLVFQEIIEPVYGTEGSGLGLGALAIQQVMSLANVANQVAANGDEVTGQSVYDLLGTTTDILHFPSDSPLVCNTSEGYPSVCNFNFPIGRYVEGGEIETVPGFESKSTVDYLP
jgi:branched-chain amino acid transport system substrate-binding protein